MKRATFICTAAGAVILLTATRFALGPLMLARLAVLGGALGLLALYDVREHRIPNRVVLPAATVCAALSLAEGVHPSSGLYVGVVLVVLLLAVSLAAPAMLGMGDVKLALLILCALNAFAPLALLITLELYALIALFLLGRRGRAALKMSLPLAPITAAACLIVLLL